MVCYSGKLLSTTRSDYQRRVRVVNEKEKHCCIGWRVAVSRSENKHCSGFLHTAQITGCYSPHLRGYLPSGVNTFFETGSLNEWVGVLAFILIIMLCPYNYLRYRVSRAESECCADILTEQISEVLALVPRIPLLNVKQIQIAKVLLRNPSWPDGSGIHFQN